MRLLFLGTAGYHPNERRQTTCLMLPEAGIVLDAGTGFFRVRKHLQTSTLDILLSHAHLDHVVGLTYLPGVLWEKNVSRVTVHGDTAKLAAIREHLFATDLFPLEPSYTPQPLAAGSLSIGDARVTHFPLKHPGGSMGYRLDWPDRSLAYVTDTTAAGKNSPYLEVIRGADLLVHECNFRDEQVQWAEQTGHSCVTQVAELAAAAQVKQLVLMHFSASDESEDPVGLAEARKHFPATNLSFDGMSIDF